MFHWSRLIFALWLIKMDKENDLKLIEVQSGSYLGEDDIIRFEDLYGRVKD